jgi:hypothetical protein
MLPIYMIAGLGFAGVLDHLTLLESGQLKGLRCVHVGKQDLWAKFYSGALMGQNAAMLQIPYVSSCKGGSAYCDATAFAAVLQEALARIQSSEAEFVSADIVSIDPKGLTFDVTLDSGAKWEVDRLDICIGPGRSRLFKGELDAKLSGEYVSSHPKLLFTGEQFLTAPDVAAGSTCVIGDGGVGAWCVERALGLNNSVLWISDKQFLSKAFPASKRNDGLLLENSIERSFVGTLEQKNAPQFLTYQIDTLSLRPRPGLTLAEGTAVKRVWMDGNRIRVAIQAEEGFRCIGNEGGETAPRSETHVADRAFDQVVFALGQEKESAESGSAAALLQNVIPTKPRDVRPYILRSENEDRMLGLRSENGALRVLGAAAMTHPTYVEEHVRWMAGASKQRFLAGSYSSTYCCQAKQEDWIPATVWAICEANQCDVTTGLADELQRTISVNLTPYDRLSDPSRLEIVEKRARSIAPLGA